MSSSVAHRRLRREYSALCTDPPPGCAVRPLKTDLLRAHFLLGVVVGGDGPGALSASSSSAEIFRDTPYEGGIYHGELRFPKTYPLGPPSVVMQTPSGRFEPGSKICFSMSNFHPELWNPM